MSTIVQLKALCKERKIKGYSGKTKEELLTLLGLTPTPTPDTIQHVVDDEESEEETTPFIVSMNTITLGDCLTHMKHIPSHSVDMVCTDPPYFLDGLGSEWNTTALQAKGSSSVVGNLPKGMKFDRDQSRRFHDFYIRVATEVFRILKPGGAFLSFSSPRLYHSMTWAIESAGFEIRDMLGWVYTQSQVKAFSQDHIIENDKSLTADQKTALKAACKDWRTPQLKPAIEPICLAVKPLDGRFIDNFAKHGTGLLNCSAETKVGPEQSMFPSNILTTEAHVCGPDTTSVFMVPKPTKTEKGSYNTHLSVKPVALISHLIRLFTRDDAIILDPFMGSGTTAVACVHTGRRYIGFDTNKDYITIANKRIQEARVSQTAP